jgi:hypothetical protein
MAGHVVGNQRLLEPQRVVGRERACRANRLVGRPFHVGVDHQRKLRAQVLAHRREPRDVFAEALAAHLHLDGAKALLQVGVGLGEQLVERQVEVHAARVARHARAMPAEQLPQRHVRAPGLQVPQGDVDGGQRQHGRTAAAAVVQGPPELLPQRLDAGRFFADGEFAEFTIEQCVDGRAVAPHRVGVADAFDAVRIPQADGVQFEVEHLPVRAVAQPRFPGRRGGAGCANGANGLPFATTICLQ